jgi:hypothetical protein
MTKGAERKAQDDGLCVQALSGRCVKQRPDSSIHPLASNDLPGTSLESPWSWDIQSHLETRIFRPKCRGDFGIFRRLQGIRSVYQSITCSVLPTPSQAHQDTILAHSIWAGHICGTALSNYGAPGEEKMIGLDLH